MLNSVVFSIFSSSVPRRIATAILLFAFISGCVQTKYEAPSGFGNNSTNQINAIVEEITFEPKAMPVAENSDDENESRDTMLVNFATYNPVFKFTAPVSAQYEVEYIPEIQAINIYEGGNSEISARDRSQIFIRFFEARDFLTLSTVDILRSEKTEFKGHQAVRYEIKKKNGIPNFPHQPVWRNGRHRLIDVRFNNAVPSYFYVLSYNPELSNEEFEKFLNGVEFHNDVANFKQPIARALERSVIKPFGIYITRENSPVQPERFGGYHTGLDFEILEGEGADATVEVGALCSGPLVQKRRASGYGGVAVQECVLNNESIMVIYGHLKTESITAKLGFYLNAGDTIGLLGADKTSETDGERKHLHLGIHRGKQVSILGYVATQNELDGWIDPMTVLQEL